MPRLLLVLSLAAGALAPACFCDIERPPPPGLQGTIAGQILVDADATSGGFAVQRSPPAATSQAAQGMPAPSGRWRDQLPPPSDVPLQQKMPVEWRAGDAIVLFETGAYDADSVPVEALLRAAAQPGITFDVVRCTARRYCHVELRRGGRLLGMEETATVVEAMQKARGAVAGVINVSCNMKKWGFRVPNDPLFSFQWHYESIGAVAAWDIQIGDPELNIAVVDSGIVKAHPDLNDRLARDPLSNAVVGVDLVSPEIDVDAFPGRDTDPEDPGDSLFGGGNHSFHGTHIAGIIGAESDNSEGITGVTWAGRIVPVRVLGNQLSGFDTDIMDGIYWAIGDPDVLGVPDNPRPARVVNLSLGGPGDQASQEFWASNMDYIFQDPDNLYDNPIFIAAAGNSDQDAGIITPANIAGMITVGATSIQGTRAVYSNFGSVVDIMAPGGDGQTDINADGQPDAILSTVATDYDMREGTSMATPHVTGIVALMVSNDPTLTQQQVEGLLRNSANIAGRCTEGCGAGSLDAVKALMLGGGQIQPEPFLATDVSQVTFPGGFAQAEVRLLNLGNAPYQFTTLIEGAQADLFSVEPASGTVSAASDVDGGTTILTVRLARGGFEAGAANLNISTTDVQPPQSAAVSLAFNDDPSREPRRVQSIEVAAFVRNPDNTQGDRVATTFALRADNFEYQLTGLRAGSYFISALADDDNDGLYETGESFGAYPNKDEPLSVAVPEDTLVPDIDFAVDSPFIVDVVGGVGQPCTTNGGECTFADGADCIDTFAGGYCSRLCDADGFCGSNGRCEVVECGVDAQGNGIPCSVCLLRCASDAQCRFSEGYVCDDGECVPDFFVNP